MAKDTRQTWQKREVPTAPTVSRHNDMAFSLIFGLIDQSTWKRISLTCFVVRLPLGPFRIHWVHSGSIHIQHPLTQQISQLKVLKGQHHDGAKSGGRPAEKRFRRVPVLRIYARRFWSGNKC